MADRRVTVDEMADAIMEGLLEYAELATDVMKDCVKKTGNTVKKETQAGAPVKTGRHKKSWRWTPMGSRNPFMRTALSIISLPTTWGMTATWNWR